LGLRREDGSVGGAQGLDGQRGFPHGADSSPLSYKNLTNWSEMLYVSKRMSHQLRNPFPGSSGTQDRSHRFPGQLNDERDGGLTRRARSREHRADAVDEARERAVGQLPVARLPTQAAGRQLQQ